MNAMQMEAMRRYSEEQAQKPMMTGATAEDARLMDEALARAVALGRPFEEQEVFQPIWEMGIELYPALDDRFQLHQEGRWKGHGDKRQFIPRLWIVRDTSDEAVHVEESLLAGDCENVAFEFPVIKRQLSLRATAQVDGEAGELEICTKENGIECFTVEEALELRELLNETYKMLYALAQQGER